jgi:hypothetical protein
VIPEIDMKKPLTGPYATKPMLLRERGHGLNLVRILQPDVDRFSAEMLAVRRPANPLVVGFAPDTGRYQDRSAPFLADAEQRLNHIEAHRAGIARWRLALTCEFLSAEIFDTHRHASKALGRKGLSDAWNKEKSRNWT